MVVGAEVISKHQDDIGDVERSSGDHQLNVDPVSCTIEKCLEHC